MPTMEDLRLGMASTFHALHSSVCLHVPVFASVFQKRIAANGVITFPPDQLRCMGDVDTLLNQRL